MNKKELSNWLTDTLKSCYQIAHPDYSNRVFWIYDEQYIRKSKLCEIENIQISTPTKITGKIIFEQDPKNKFFWIHYSIWKLLEKDITNVYSDVKKVVNITLKNKSLKDCMKKKKYPIIKTDVRLEEFSLLSNFICIRKK